MGFLIVRIEENINEFLTAHIKVLGPTVMVGEAMTDGRTDRQTDRQTDRNVGNIYGFVV